MYEKKRKKRLKKGTPKIYLEPDTDASAVETDHDDPESGVEENNDEEAHEDVEGAEGGENLEVGDGAESIDRPATMLYNNSDSEPGRQLIKFEFSVQLSQQKVKKLKT